MRHRVKGRKLGRTRSHRVATLISLATALFHHKKITTTLAKAKEAKRFIEPLITKAKVDSVHTRRYVSDQIKDKAAVKELFGEIIGKVGDRAGGYTRVVKLGTRLGDAAEMAILELVDYNELAPKKTKSKKKAKKEKTVKDEKPAAAKEIEDAEIIEEIDTVKEEAPKEIEESVVEKPKKVEEPKTEKKTAKAKAPKKDKPKTEKKETKAKVKEKKTDAKDSKEKKDK
jgi:large subunit ribosomal protein L17